MEDRNETIVTIRRALKRRTGRPWSVKGGRGTAWGWITINAPPARCIFDWEGAPSADGQYMSRLDRDQLAKVLGLTQMSAQGESIPASAAYRREFVARAEGREIIELAKPYWD